MVIRSRSMSFEGPLRVEVVHHLTSFPPAAVLVQIIQLVEDLVVHGAQRTVAALPEEVRPTRPGRGRVHRPGAGHVRPDHARRGGRRPATRWAMTRARTPRSSGRAEVLLLLELIAGRSSSPTTRRAPGLQPPGQFRTQGRGAAQLRPDRAGGLRGAVQRQRAHERLRGDHHPDAGDGREPAYTPAGTWTWCARASRPARASASASNGSPGTWPVWALVWQANASQSCPGWSRRERPDGAGVPRRGGAAAGQNRGRRRVPVRDRLRAGAVRGGAQDLRRPAGRDAPGAPVFMPRGWRS